MTLNPAAAPCFIRPASVPKAAIALAARPIGGLLVAIPAYRCAGQIGRVLAQITPEIAAQLREVLVIDNRSPDGTAAAALAAAKTVSGVPVKVIRNAENYGLGGSQKQAFRYAIEHDFGGVIILHGDDQATLADIMPAVSQHPTAECILGSRFERGSRLVGYSAIRTVANRVFNIAFSLVGGRWVTDLGSGLNYYRVSWLVANRDCWDRAHDDLCFNYGILLRSCFAGASLRFVPISWREEDQLSNVRAVRQMRAMVRMLASAIFSRRRWVEARHGRAASGLAFDEVAAP